MRIRLSLNELLVAAHSGVMRRVHAIKSGHRMVSGAPVDLAWQMDVLGACGEMAVAKHLGIYWAGRGAFDGADVGFTNDHIEVRTAMRNKGSLILREKDKDDSYYYLVLTDGGQDFEVVGWILGRDGKRPEYVQAPNGRPSAWFVPMDSLHHDSHLQGAA